MDNLLGTSLGVFIGLTLFIAGGAAILTGKAIAETWRPLWQVVFACFGLALADRFLIYALFEGDLLHLPGFLIHFAVLSALAILAWRITLAHCMVAQYPWKVERASLFTWREHDRG